MESSAGNGSHTHRSRQQSAAAMQMMTRHCHPAGCPALMQTASRGVAEESSFKSLIFFYFRVFIKE